MRDLNIGFLPVSEGTGIIGVVTDRDIVVRALAEGMDPDRALVSDIMTTPILTCSEQDSIEQAAKLMEEKQVHRLLVLDEQGKMCGVLSLGDLAAKAHTQQLVGEAVEYISQPCAPNW